MNGQRSTAHAQEAEGVRERKKQAVMATDNVAVELRDALTKNAKRVVDLFLAYRRGGVLLGGHIKDGRGYDGETALHLCSRAGHTKCVTVLLEHAADFHATNA